MWKRHVGQLKLRVEEANMEDTDIYLSFPSDNVDQDNPLIRQRSNTQ